MRENSPDFYPSVSLLISAYNEEESIAEKIRNSLSLDYPKDLMDIVVISDGSKDRTNEISKTFLDQGVILKDFPGRNGKTVCLNWVVPSVKGEIIVFSDANSSFPRNALKDLVKHFVRPEIGFVSGTTKYLSQEKGEKVFSVRIYAELEKKIKALESQIGSCVGADGAIFAIRKSLYRELKDFDINDLVTPFHIIKQGYRGILESNACCLEKSSEGVFNEFRRQVRITNRTVRAILNHSDLLNPFRFGIFSFHLLFHKFLRLMVPIFLLILLWANIGLLNKGFVYEILLFGQFSFYSITAWRLLDGNRRRVPWFISFPAAFGVMNLAIIIAWLKYFRGETFKTWEVRR